MVGWHCGARVSHQWSTSRYFAVRCIVCKKVFKQRKRQSAKAKAQGDNLITQRR